MHKKGDIGYGIYMIIGIAALALILILFSTIFFFLGIAKSETSVISGAYYKDSTLLLNILRTEITENKITIAEAMNNLDQEKIKEIDNLLTILPRPKNRISSWVLEAYKDNKIFFNSGEQVISGDKYLEQEITLPIKSKETITVKLYLSCEKCTKEEIEVLA